MSGASIPVGAAATGPRGALLRGAALLDRAVRVLAEAVVLISGIALLTLLFANVVSRYVTAAGGLDWIEEVPEKLFPWFIMAGVVLAAQGGGHMAVEWILPKLGRGAKRVLLVAGHLAVVATYAILVREALEVAGIAAMERSPVLGLPNSHGYYALAAGCALLAFSTATIALRLVLVGPEALPQPAPEEVPTA
ncbi:TRAP transporter small permease subunit [Roseomonas sp. NAR14]|uniref:TRAP transporter small permease protein n=1 Tax=Roseomonas acroporae TaxID=2937791 RepID=A0A9X2BU21_9PROT|nr:TRAP transporter small permease subunit [Roseomonas acroporae]MCK8784962.1 TRAP transporter small permease subunit [Roseomonas acroporae]